MSDAQPPSTERPNLSGKDTDEITELAAQFETQLLSYGGCLDGYDPGELPCVQNWRPCREGLPLAHLCFRGTRHEELNEVLRLYSDQLLTEDETAVLLLTLGHVGEVADVAVLLQAKYPRIYETLRLFVQHYHAQTASSWVVTGWQGRSETKTPCPALVEGFRRWFALYAAATP